MSDKSHAIIKAYEHVTQSLVFTDTADEFKEANKAGLNELARLEGEFEDATGMTVDEYYETLDNDHDS